MKIADVDLDNNIITVHEKKRVKGKATTRRVPLSAFLAGVMRDWLANHPGGPWLFCHQPTVARSKKRSATTGHAGRNRPTAGKARQATVKPRNSVAAAPLTKDEVNHHFRRTLKGSKWDVIRGPHTLRHTFISACASCGVDQRLVESFAGHMSAETSRRYAHLYPSAQQAAIAAVFDGAMQC
jgi:integrase